MHPQRGAAAVFLVLSATYLALAFRIEDVATASTAAVGPRGFPILVGSLGVLLSLLLLASPTTAPHDALATGGGHAGDDTAPPRSVFGGDWRRVLALCALTLLYAAALPAIGFALSTTGFLAASFRLLGERRPTNLVLVPLAIALVSLALLRGALGAYLPEPIFEAVLSSLAR